MNPVLTIILIGWSLLPGLANADCNVDEAGLYGLFKKYREQVNTATRLNQLNGYFSAAFNFYYTSKLENPESEDSKTRYLTQYWDNLNTAKDIVIIYEYSTRCEMANNKAGAAVLSLVVVLDPAGAASPDKVDLWNVKIHYVHEDRQWLINSVEYTKSYSRRTYNEGQIIDNFATLR